MDSDRLDIPKYNKALSFDAREEINLRTRCAFTSFQTKYFHVISLLPILFVLFSLNKFLISIFRENTVIWILP